MEYKRLLFATLAVVIVLRFSIMEIYVLEINKSSEAKNNVNSLVIGEIGGHSSLQTTMKYVHADAKTKANAVAGI